MVPRALVHRGLEQRSPAPRALLLVVVAALIAVTAACGSSGGKAASPASGSASGPGTGSTGNKASAPGISSTAVKVAFVVNQTGAAASAQAGSIDGVKARIALQNAQGGVSGRQIELTVEDDQSVPSNELPVVQKAVQQQGTFAVLEESVLFGGAYRYLQQQKVPVLTGYANDGQEWGDPSISNMFQATGSTSPTAPPVVAIMKVLKARGATKLALLAYGGEAASIGLADSLQKAAAAEGIQLVYVNKTIQLPATGLSTVALQVQKSGADSLVTALAPADDFAARAAVKQQGANLKVPVILNYGQDVIATGPDRSVADGATIVFPYAPLELNTAATKTFDDALHKYSSLQGVPSIGAYDGWAAADLFIHGLQLAGQNPTREGYIAALHGETHFTVGGLEAPVDLAQNKQGTYADQSAGNCAYGASVKAGKFIPLTGNPFCP